MVTLLIYYCYTLRQSTLLELLLHTKMKNTLYYAKSNKYHIDARLAKTKNEHHQNARVPLWEGIRRGTNGEVICQYVYFELKKDFEVKTTRAGRPLTLGRFFFGQYTFDARLYHYNMRNVVRIPVLDIVWVTVALACLVLHFSANAGKNQK